MSDDSEVCRSIDRSKMKTLDIKRIIWDICRKCGKDKGLITVVQAYEAHCLKSGQVLFSFKCLCGHSWARNRTPDLEMTEIGLRTTFERKGLRLNNQSRIKKHRPPNFRF